ncbi:MAG TPA: response regulator transcription factor [Luteibaculaceae bacterium]|nr:response regulator transcription factor [Luteibaculaceae bacterium]
MKKNTRILIVEDEERVSNVLKIRLEENDFACDIAGDGNAAIQQVSQHNYDCVILDINLPLVNGYDVCREIRGQNTEVPIIMLTALGSGDHKLKGFDLGADDYLVKPFVFEELLAKIRVFLRRTTPSPVNANVLRIHDLEIHYDSKLVVRAGQEINLTSKEFQLLALLAKHPGMVFSKAEIAEKVWNIHFDTGTNIIEVYVNYLRKKIDKGFEIPLIQTKVGFGYFFLPV